MPENYITLTFTRDREDDAAVIGSIPSDEEGNVLANQLLKEFQEFEGRLHILEVGLGARDYQIKARLDLPSKTEDEPGTILIETAESLQAIYNQHFAGGSFEIDTLVINGQKYLADDLAAAIGPGI